MRTPTGRHSAPPPACLTTEYRERFLTPRLSARTHSERRNLRSRGATQNLIQHPTMVQGTETDPLRSVAKQILSQAAEARLPSATLTQSVYQDDFRAWEAIKRGAFKLSDNLKVSSGAFATTTTCRDAFCPKTPIKATENFRPRPPVRESRPFDGTTNYNMEFVSHPVQLRTFRERSALKCNSAPLTRVITSHENFKGLPQEPARSCKPQLAWTTNPAPFEGTSEFREKFQNWPLEPKFQRKAQEYIPPVEPMTLLSTTHSDYMAHKFQRPRSARLPVETRRSSREPLQTRSTMKEDFRVWDVVRCPPIIHKEELQWSSEDVEKTTTYRSVFTPKQAQRAISCKPTPRPPSQTRAAMEGTTTYHSTYNTPPQQASSGGRLDQNVSVDGGRLALTAEPARGVLPG